MRTSSLFTFSGFCLLLSAFGLEALGADCVPPPSGLIAWWPAESNALDHVGANHAVLNNGATFAPGKVGTAFLLDGVNDYVSIAHSPTFSNLPQISFMVWFKFNALPAGKLQMIFVKGLVAGPNSNCFWLFRDPASGRILAGVETTAGLCSLGDLQAFNDTNSFHLAVVTYDGAQAILYLDGAPNSTNFITGNIRTAADPVHLGRRNGAGVDGVGDVMNGLLDEAAIFNRALTAQEVQALFNAGSAGKCPPACVPQPSGGVSWWRGETNANDFIGSHNGTLQNGATFAAGKVGTAFSFDGVDDVVSVPDAPGLRFGPAIPMTVDLWVYRTSGNSRQHIIGKRSGCTGSSTEGTFQLYLNADTAEGLGFGGPGGSCACSGQNLPLNAWTHLAGTFDGTTLRMYINGQLAATTTGSLGPSNSAPLLLGGSGACERFGGLIDEVGLYNRVLSSDEIAAIYAAGSAGKCDPRPTLNIAALPGAVRLTWTTNAPGFLLETNSALTLPAGWGVLASNYSVLNTNFTVTNSVGGAAKFYRLHKP